MKRVLFVVANDWYFFCHRLPLARRIAAAGYEVHVATPPGRFTGEIQAAGIPHWPIQMDRQGRSALTDLKTVANLIALYRQIRPDIVHHVALKPIIYGSMAARVAGVPAIVNAMPGMGYVFLSDQMLSRMIRPAVKTAFRLLLNGPNCRVILQNPDNVAQWVSWRVLREDRIVLIRGAGVDTDQLQPTHEPEGTPLTVLPARLLYDKGVAEFVEAARLIRGRGIEARFALVGDGDPGNPASVPPEQLQRWASEGVIELFGWRDDMARVLAQAHIVCLPSYGEGLPKALLEAAACGKPIVATDVPGCREAVRDGDNGWLVPPRNAEALASALLRLISDPSLRRSMGARGRERAVAEFSIAIVAEATAQLYGELLESTGAAKAP